MIYGCPPDSDQLEITLLGPGRGECCLVHVGDGRWVVIDSCIHSETRQPAALHYLESLGIEPVDAVHLIVATHWHDDHIAGIARIVEACPNASFCTANSLTKQEFLAVVTPYAERTSVAGGSGVGELFQVIDHHRRADGSFKSMIYAAKDRTVLTTDSNAHGRSIEVKTLSPSDAQFEKFLTEIGSLMPKVRETRRRLTPQAPNHLSVVTWFGVGEVGILLGGDLEETTDVDTGWSVIVSSTTRPKGRAFAFKVPHHGSDNAHSADVWTEMLTDGPYAILTPFNSGRTKRPSRGDVSRITALTPNAYITAGVKGRRARRRSPMVERTIRETVGRLRHADSGTGCIRLRNGGTDAFESWEVELFAPAMPLSALYAA